jgi:hypothetical protein
MIRKCNNCNYYGWVSSLRGITIFCNHCHKGNMEKLNENPLKTFFGLIISSIRFIYHKIYNFKLK